MATRRMLSISVVDSDTFCALSSAAQALYFHLCTQADDDGFTDRTKQISAKAGATGADMDALISAGFIIPFGHNVFAIRHWWVHNLIKKDRYRPTFYQDERATLSVKSNRTYEEIRGDCGGDMGPETPACGPRQPVSDGNSGDSLGQSVSEVSPDWVRSGSEVSPNCLRSVSEVGPKCIRNGSVGKVRLSQVSISQANGTEETCKPSTSEGVQNKNITCAEQQSSPAPDAELILSDGSYFRTTGGDFLKWTLLYPSVDIRQELRNMAGWCDSHPKRRKSREGIRGFITAWLSKAQAQADKQRGIEVETGGSGNVFIDLMEQMQDEQG